MNKLILIAICMLMSGCMASLGPKFDGKVVLEEGRAKLFVYRKKNFYAGGNVGRLHINGEKYLPLINGGYAEIDLTPGSYLLSVPKNVWDYPFDTEDFLIELKSGDVYYLNYSLVGDQFYGRGTFKIVDKESALLSLTNIGRINQSDWYVNKK